MPRRLFFNDLPKVLPIFPLEGALLLPHARLPLNIFEPRYLAMLDDTLKTDHRLIGMIQPRNTDADPVEIYQIGCAGRVTTFSETDDGRYLIGLSGAIRFRVAAEVDGFTPYRRVEADWRSFESDLRGSTPDMSEDERSGFLDLLRRYFEASNLSSDWSALARADRQTLINAISMLCPFSPQEKQALLEAPTLEDRERDLRALMAFVVADPNRGDDLQ